MTDKDLIKKLKYIKHLYQQEQGIHTGVVPTEADKEMDNLIQALTKGEPVIDSEMEERISKDSGISVDYMLGLANKMKYNPNAPDIQYRKRRR